MSGDQETSYAEAIRSGFRYLLSHYPEVFVVGQGLWAPWYVGTSMLDLDKEFGTERVMDSPVSEAGVTGVAIGASLLGFRPVVVHPRMDFLILAVDPIVNQAAKWSSMFGGTAHPAVTFRGILNRGGEQGAQHSQALHSWFAHVPGLRVVMPATPADARDLLIASVLCDDPVLYIDDRWLYGERAVLAPIGEKPLGAFLPQRILGGRDLTLVGCGWSSIVCRDAATLLQPEGIEAEVVDLRVLNPLNLAPVIDSVRKTKRLVAVDGSSRTCGVASEVVATVCEAGVPLLAPPLRITLPDAPAPTSSPLERTYYFTADSVAQRIRNEVLAPSLHECAG